MELRDQEFAVGTGVLLALIALGWVGWSIYVKYFETTEAKMDRLWHAQSSLLESDLYWPDDTEVTFWLRGKYPDLDWDNYKPRS